MDTESYRLSCPRRFTYSVGHVLNDLCASIWFSYLLVFFHNVISFSNSMAGNVMLLGQVTDAVCTPFIGYEIDRTNGFCNYTKRKSWHLIGTICVAVSFPFLFMECLGCPHAEDWAKFIFYAGFVVLFQFGWAATQVSHLSLIPELTPSGSERVELNAMRYAFTVLSNLVVYSAAWLLLSHADDGGSSTHLSKTDAPHFRLLALIMVGTGIVFSAIFHVGTSEERDSHGRLEVSSEHSRMTWKHWFKEPQFFLIAALYMCTRLMVNISQIYIPMYLTNTLQLHKKYIAIIPLVVFISGFVMSVVMKPMNRLAGRKFTYLIGVVLIISSCVWMYFLDGTHAWQIFSSAILLGAGCSTILVTSLSMTADLIGKNTSSGAFVYGSMSLTDKLSNGTAVVLIQNFHPCKTQVCCPACVWYYRDCMVFIPGGIACLAILILLALAPQTIGLLRRHRGQPEAAGRPVRKGADERSALLGSTEGESSGYNTNEEEAECCDYGLCFGISREAPAKAVSGEDWDRSDHANYNTLNINTEHSVNATGPEHTTEADIVTRPEYTTPPQH